MILADLKYHYKRHAKWVPVAAFVGGFIFDLVVLTRIDDIKVILQQALYLLVAAVLISVELIEEDRNVLSPKILSKVWMYREVFLHFLMGTLLNSYAIFYFKSASALTSLFFIALLVGLLTLNEFKRFGKSQTQVHVAFFSLCVISYFASLAPTLMGYIGTVPFLCSVLASAIVFLGYNALIKNRMGGDPSLRRLHFVYPYVAIQTLFVILYFMNAIPPVPLSVKYMGIYHGVEKVEGGWQLSYTRPRWKFWQHGDQTYLARSGDQIFCYAQIFSPTHFKDQLQVRWLYHDEVAGWTSSDAIPMPVAGGREEGYRAVTKKDHYRPGTWRVQIETTANQEIGRINFEVVADEGIDAREANQIIR